MEAINATRQRVWEKQPVDFLWHAFIDMDGTLAGTFGECKGGMALSYKGIWGYAPLIITLANTREVGPLLHDDTKFRSVTVNFLDEFQHLEADNKNETI
jgi:hypothetical protein